MRIIFFSDPHNCHKNLNVPDGDLVICAGDATKRGTVEEFLDFLEWFDKLPHFYKIFIGGNHDSCLDYKLGPRNSRLLHKLGRFVCEPTNCYLENKGVQIEGINFWGSPNTPLYGEKNAFSKKRGFELRSHWNIIPEEVDILITHGPSKFTNDQIIIGEFVGDEDLSYHIGRVRPKLHLHGHIHESRGVTYDKGTVFINGVVTKYDNEIAYPCWVIDYEENNINIHNLT